MDNLIILNESKKNSLEFDLDVEGLDTTNVKVAYVLETKDYNMAFQCSQKKDKTWSVTIPPLSHIEKSTYKYHISVIAEGYYFEPLTGVANVEGSHQVYATKPEKAKTKDIDIKQVIGEETSHSEPTVEKKIEQPKKVVETKKEEQPAQPVKKTEEKKQSLPSDDVVQKIINESKKKREVNKVRLKETKPETTTEPKKEQGRSKKQPLPSDNVIQKIIESSKSQQNPEPKSESPSTAKKSVFRRKDDDVEKKPVVENKKETKVEPPKPNEKDERIRKLLKVENQQTQQIKEKKVTFKKGSVIVH